MGFGQTHGAPYHGYGYIPLRFGGNVVRRMGTQQQHTMGKKTVCIKLFSLETICVNKILCIFKTVSNG